MTVNTPALPPVATPEEWEKARAELLVAEKAATRQLDKVAAQRRRLPMVPVENFSFEGPNGKVTLRDLFGEKRQLAVYQFMDVGREKICEGCEYGTDAVHGLEHLRHAGIAWATISNMPIEQMKGAWKDHPKWSDITYASSHGTTWTKDMGIDKGPGFMFLCFIRDGDKLFKTYSTTHRGFDRIGFAINITDLAPWGRQEDWEDSPEGWPQHKKFTGEPGV